MLVAVPHRPGHLFDELEAGFFDRVAEGGGQDDVPAGVVAVLDLVQREHRSPGDPELFGELGPGRGEVGDDDADVVVGGEWAAWFRLRR